MKKENKENLQTGVRGVAGGEDGLESSWLTNKLLWPAASGTLAVGTGRVTNVCGGCCGGSETYSGVDLETPNTLLMSACHLVKLDRFQMLMTSSLIDLCQSAFYCVVV